MSVQLKEFCCNIKHQAFGLKSKLYFIKQVSNFPLLLIFIFLSIQTSTLLFQDDGIMNRMSSRFKKSNDLQTFPLSSFSLLYREIREVVFKYFLILHLSTKLGVKKINNCYFILRPLNVCVASDKSFAQADIWQFRNIEAGIERLLLLLQMTPRLAQNPGRMFVCSTCRCKRV